MSDGQGKWSDRKKWGMGILASVIVVAVGAFFIEPVRHFFFPPPEVDRHLAPPEIVSIDELCAIEKKLTPGLYEGPARQDSLLAYFEDANPRLFKHLRSIVKKHASGEEHRGATYIAGSSGVGKSYLIGQLDMLPKEVTSDTVKLSEFFKDKAFPFETEEAADLQTVDGELIFNRLSRLTNPSEFDVNKFIVAAGATKGDKPLSFILIDDLDEIHEDSAKVILEELEAFINNSPDGFAHFVVFGRPEGFWPWLKHSDRTPPPNVTNPPFVLQGPVYETTGDLAFRANNYHIHKYHSLAPEEVISDFQGQLRQYPFLRYTIRPLSAGNFVLDEAFLSQRFPLNGHKSPEQLRMALYSDLIDRNKESHGLPASDDDQYAVLLQLAAVFPLRNDRTINSEGYFEVYVHDYIEFKDSKEIWRRLRLRDVLNRSGIAYMDPCDVRRTRYRFQPFWIHAHLVESWNNRNHSEHKYRWCNE
jgi:hypothetical protein